MKINGMLLSLGILIMTGSLYTMNQKDASDFVRAGYFGEVNELERLLRQDPSLINVIHLGNSALHFAAQEGQAEAAKFLLEHNANVHLLNDNGHTPLHVAVVDGQKEAVVKVLLDHGADINLESNGHILHLAVGSGKIGIVGMILAKGADVNQRNINGVTPLHVAAARDFDDIARLLLEYGATITRDECCNYPFIWNDSLIKYLLRQWPQILRDRLAQARLALYMCFHRRVGATSNLGTITQYCVQDIANMLKPEDFCKKIA